MNEPRTESKKREPASVELDGKGKFYLYNGTSPDKEYGLSGSSWLVDSKSGATLIKDGIDSLLENPDTQSDASIFINAQGKIGDKPGLLIDFYNDPSFKNVEDFRYGRGRAQGIIDALAITDKKEPFVGMVSELLRALLTSKASELGHKSNSKTMFISNVFFHNTRNPDEVIKKVFEGYQYSVIGRSHPSFTETIELSLPISQFLE